MAVDPFADAVTVIVNGPVPTDRIIPVVSIRATVVSLLLHVSCTPDIVPPVTDEAVAPILTESPAAIVSDVVLILTAAIEEFPDD